MGDADELELPTFGTVTSMKVAAAQLAPAFLDRDATIDKVLTDLDGLNARQVSDRSHDEAGWRLVEFGDTIPYEAALVGARQVSTPTVRDRHLQGRVMAGRADRRGRL